MYVPRILIVAGAALIAISLGASGHGFWWIFPLVWVFGGRRRAWRACYPDHQYRGARWHSDAGVEPGPSAGRDDVPPSGPDPTRDRHEAFPSSR